MTSRRSVANDENTDESAPITSPKTKELHHFGTLYTPTNVRKVAYGGTTDISSPLVFSDTPSKSNQGQTPKRFKSSRGITENQSSTRLVIWGTDIVVEECKEEFIAFLHEFIPIVHLNEQERIMFSDEFDLVKPLYMQKLEHLSINEKSYIDIDGMHLKMLKPNLYKQLIAYPQEIIPTFDVSINVIFNQLYSESGNELPAIQIRIYNIDRTKNMRDLNPDDIDMLISIQGLVIRCSALLPEMNVAFFQCCNCKATYEVVLEGGRIVEPSVCKNCNSSRTLTIIHNRSAFSDKQLIKLQETPEDMPAGQTPYTVLLVAYSNLVNQVQPGDRITVTGIYRAIPNKINPRQRNVLSVYKTYIDSIHFYKVDKSNDCADSEESSIQLSNERIEQIIKLSKDPNIYTKLANAIAPNIYENLEVKKGILLQLFGGTNKDLKNLGRTRFRSEINILLCGDPGTSKSQLLKYVHDLVPRSQYTSGKGSSAVGLTVYVTKDPDTKQLVLQTGALVMSDNGICCIDEFDKMTDSTRSVLHEVMEQQTLSIAKAGIICQLNARTSILAAANPVKSKWDPNLTTVENIKLPHTLLSRFDLIFLILDPQSEIFDRKLANHLVSLYSSDTGDHVREQEQVDKMILKDYIAYARNKFHPLMSKEAGDFLKYIYVEMRKLGNVSGCVSAYPRQLESLIRLAESHAKMRFSQQVQVVDVEEAVRLHKEALKQSCMDPKTGMIDINILTSGFSISSLKARNELAKVIRQFIDSNYKRKSILDHIPISGLYEHYNKNFQHISHDEFEACLRLLSDESYLGITGKTVKIFS